MITERQATTINGWFMAGALIFLELSSIISLVAFILTLQVLWLFAFILGTVVVSIGAVGFFIVNPNEAKVIQLFGNYAGTAKQPGLWWMNPLCYPKRKVSQRVRNFESDKLKVNDHDGNPIEIASVVVWRVDNTAEAIFQVDNYENFVEVQSEAALRNLATTYPYDSNVEGELALRRSTAEITDKLRAEIQERLADAGIDVIEARISHLAYAPEIASAMLRRQQAGAVVAARALIVEGAVGMVEMALESLASAGVVQMDDEKKAAMVSNLMVVLCGDRDPMPIVNTGTLYH